MNNGHENTVGRLWAQFTFRMVKLSALQDDVELAVRSSKTEFVLRGKERFDQGKKVPIIAEKLEMAEKELGAEGLAKLMEMSAQDSLGSLRARVDAASIVFAHSLLDSLLYSLCILSNSIAPDDWLDSVRKCQVTLEELLKENVHKITAQASKRFVESLERQSLCKKAELLHSVCKPKDRSKLLEGYTFSAPLLQGFDKRRHDIVHGEKQGAEVTGTPPLDYARMTGFYFLVMVLRKYSLRMALPPEEILAILKNSN